MRASSLFKGFSCTLGPDGLIRASTPQEKPHLCLQVLHAAKFQVFRGAYILLRELVDTKSQEAQGLLEEIRRQSSVSVLSGPAIMITNVATASVFLAKGWSTESVSRVVRTSRTAQEKHEKGTHRACILQSHT